MDIISCKIGATVHRGPAGCEHCGTIDRALNPVEDLRCECACHAARRFDLERVKKSAKRGRKPGNR